MKQTKPTRRFTQQEVRKTADQLAGLLQRVFQRYGDRGSVPGHFPTTGRGDGSLYDSYRLAAPGDRLQDYHTRLNAMQGKGGPTYVYTRPKRYERRGILVSDISGSPRPGSNTALYERGELAAAAAELLLGTAFEHGCKPGLILSRDGRTQAIPPGSDAGLLFKRLDEAAASTEPGRFPECLATAKTLGGDLEFAIVVADFLLTERADLDNLEHLEQWEEDFLALGRRLELVVFQIADPWDSELPDLGRQHLDGGGRIHSVNTSDRKTRAAYRKRTSQRQARLQEILRQARADHYVLETTSPILDQFAALAKSERKFRRTA